MDHDSILSALIPAVHAAGDAILDIYRGEIPVRHKDDESPVTLADEVSEQILVAHLNRIAPGIRVIAEEAMARSSHAGWVTPAGSVFWLVDPLDGTREFIDRNDEFTINIGLIEHGEPTLGIVLAPALGQMYCGTQAGGAFIVENGARRPIGVRPLPVHGLTVLASRRHDDPAAIDALLAGCRIAERRAAGSSLKFCLIAAGQADAYPRAGRTMEWDTAAGHAVLRAAGGSVVDLAGDPLRYGKPGFANPSFIARGGAATANAPAPPTASPPRAPPSP